MFPTRSIGGAPLTGDKDVSDADIEDFLSNYELLAAAYRHELINQNVAEDAFSYDLEKALKDPRVKQHLQDERAEESDIYDGVLELARAWGISTDCRFSQARRAHQAGLRQRLIDRSRVSIFMRGRAVFRNSVIYRRPVQGATHSFEKRTARLRSRGQHR